jgi:hypothetical protein
VDASQEFAENFSWSPEENRKDYTHTVSILVYRRTQPPAFTRFPGTLLCITIETRSHQPHR